MDGLTLFAMLRESSETIVAARPEISSGVALAHSASDQLDLEAVGVFQVGGVMVGPASEWVLVREHQLPAVELGFVGEFIGLVSAASMEGQVVEPRPAAVMTAGRACR